MRSEEGIIYLDTVFISKLLHVGAGGQTWILGMKPNPFARATSVLSLWPISLVPNEFDADSTETPVA